MGDLRVPPASVPPQGGFRQDMHTVSAGETLHGIAGRYGLSVEDLARANPQLAGAEMRPGQILTIPGTSSQTGSAPSGTLTVADQFERTAGLTAFDAPPAAATGQAGGAVAESAVTVQEIQLRRADPPQSTEGATGPASDVRSRLVDAGMTGVHTPPTDQEIRTYFAQHAPAHDLISSHRFGDAAAEYRRLAAGESDAERRGFLETTARQLDSAQTMQDAGVRRMSFPPSEANVRSYFHTLRGQPLGEVNSAFQNYVRAFYVHSESQGVSRGDVVYDRDVHRVGNTRVIDHNPEDWADVTTNRELHTDGRRIIDCEGYVMLGQRCLTAAGFSNVQYAVATRRDNPNTARDESATSHIMLAASRRAPDGDGREIAVVSNDHITGRVAAADENFDSEQSEALVRAYRQTYGGSAGTMVVDSTPWGASLALQNALSPQAQPQQTH